jgi:hypothetical protein
MNNDIVSLLMEAKKEGIVTVIENDQLVFRVQKGTTVSPDLIKRLKEKKPDIFFLPFY